MFRSLILLACLVGMVLGLAMTTMRMLTMITTTGERPGHRPMTLPSEFPFVAIVGQQSLKTALLINAIDPRVGGVLISGPRGSAKSTLARALADVLPLDAEGKRPPFVNLPLGASEDRLIGSLDLQQVLSEREATLQQGLLARADGGVLYVDEINLLPDSLVDVMLDVAARGINTVERDGISHAHSARFSLIGTMNPDEGELRPQLLDRFGLCLQQQTTPSVQERIAIVQQREAFERDPAACLASHRAEQLALIDIPPNLDPALTGYRWLTRRLEQQPHIHDGLVCENDELARGCLTALQDHGLSVPGDVAVTGFDDLPSLAESLTTVRQDIASIATMSVELLSEALAGKSPRHVSMPVELVIRETG